MTKLADQINEKDVYSYTFPASMVNIIFNNAGAQTNDLTVNATKPYFYGDAWYALDEIPTEGGEGGDDPVEPTLANGFYLIGQNGWTVAALNADLKFAVHEGDEYVLTATLAENDPIKVVKVENDVIVGWYPDGEGTEYTVDAAHAGEKDIYFQEAYKADWSEFGGYFWMGENQVVPVADFTQPFVLKFNGNGTSDNSNTFKVEDGIAAIFDAASVPYVSALTTVANVYAGRTIADEPSSLKFGTSSKQGTLAFTLAQAIEVDSIVVNATQYGNNAAKITVNGVEFDLTVGNKVPQDCKITPEDAVSAISIAQSGSERIYLRNIRIYPKAEGGEGGDDPQPEENMTVYFVNVPGWDAVNAYVWGAAGSYQEWPGEAMTKLADQINEKDVYSYTFPASMVNIIFNNAGAQTNDLTVNATKPYFYGDAWYALDEIPTEGGEGGDDPQPEENMTVYFVNVPGWDAVNAYVWGAAGSYQEWPGEAMTKLADQINEKDVYSYTFPASMVNIIFNNAGAQTNDLTVNATKPYFYGDAWYALDEIPTEGGEGGDDPVVVETKDIQVVPGAWAEYKLGAWAWSETLEGAWYAVALENEQLIAKVPVAADHIIIATFAADAELNWDNKIAQTSDLEIAECGVLYINDGTPTWCEEAQGGDDPQPVEVAYYLVGSMNNWTPAEAYKFGTDESCAEGEFILHATLAENDEIKVVKVQEGQDDVYYPEGMDNNYVVDAAHAGDKDIYFRPAGNADWSAFGGYFWMGANEDQPEETNYIVKWDADAEQVIGQVIYHAAAATASTKIHGNQDNVTAINLSSSYKYASDQYVVIKPATGTFKAGDKVSFNTFINNGTTDGSKYGAVYFYAADGATVLFQGQNGINGRVSEDDPAVENFTLEADQDSILFGRYGNTATYVSVLYVTREGGDDPQPAEPAYYLVGSMNDWTPAEAYKFGTDESCAEGEFILHATLAENDEIKVVKVQEGQDDVYYPEGMDNNYVVDAAHAGDKDIYFRPAGNQDWSEFGGYFWMGENVEPQPETVTLYFINANGWENIHAYVWIDDNNQYVAWPGEEVTLTELTYNEMAIYSYTFPAIYKHIIFNGSLGEESKQTLDLAVNAATPYLYTDTWYASLEEIPAVVVPAKFYVMMGGEAIKVTEDNYTIENLEADVEYSLKISLDGTWQTLMGFSALTDVADGLHTNDAEDILFTLAEAGDVVVTYIAPATEGGEYTFTVTGNFVPYVEPTHTYTVAGPKAIFVSNWDPEYAANDMVKQEDGTYKWEQEGFEFAVGTIEFKVCKDHSWNPSYPAQGNYSLNIPEDGIYTLTIYFNPAEASINAVATKTGDKVFDPTITYYLVGLNGDFSTKLEAYKLTETSDVEGQFEVAVTLAVGDEFKILAAQEGHQDVYFPDGLNNNYVVDAAHAGENTVYFRPDYNGGEGWFAGCIYVPANEGTNIDNVNAAVEAVKIFRNGQLLIIKGEKTYTIMGQVVK